MTHDLTLFPARLLEARKARKWRALDVAEISGLSAAHISHFERGTRLPTITNLVRLADALEVSTDWLLGRE